MANTNLLCLSLVGSLILVINATEIGHDDWNWKRDDQDTAEGADTAHYFAYHGCRYHISVPVSVLGG